MIELKEITANNLSGVLNLSVFEHQKSFVSTTAYSLAQAYVYRETAFPFAVYLDNVVIGFIMFGYYEFKQQYTLWKFLIDKKYQNMGHGKEALQQGLLILKKCTGAGEVFTGVALGNEKAKRLYASVGFIPTGLIENNMEEMKYCYE